MRAAFLAALAASAALPLALAASAALPLALAASAALPLALAVSAVLGLAGTVQAADAAEHLTVPAPGGASIDVLAQGSGPLVVLLPSRGRAAEDFDPIAGPIAAAGYRVLRPEPRGIGGSTGPTAGLNLHDLGGDVDAVIEAAHGGPAVVVGHAFGNFVARTVASDRPDLVRGVVIAAAAGRHYPDALAAAVTASSDTARADAARLPDLRRTFFAPGHDPAVWLGGWYPAVDAYQRAATLRTQQSDWWAAGRAPLLEIQAADDPFKTPDQRGELKAEFGDRVTVELIPDAGHALVPEQPRAVAEAIVGWMATH